MSFVAGGLYGCNRRLLPDGGGWGDSYRMSAKEHTRTCS